MNELIALMYVCGFFFANQSKAGIDKCLSVVEGNNLIPDLPSNMLLKIKKIYCFSNFITYFM